MWHQRAIDLVLGRLDSVQAVGTSGWMALCPSHDDHNRSLSVSVGHDGRVLVNCFAGCSAEQIVNAMGLRIKDLFDKRDIHMRHYPSDTDATVQRKECTLGQYAKAKKLNRTRLRDWDVYTFKSRGRRVLRISYRDANGHEKSVRYRIAIKGKDKFRWKRGNKPILYGLWRLPEMQSKDYIVLVEGESDCHTLWSYGIPALGVPGATQWRDDRDAEHLSKFKSIYVVVEPDQGGDALRKRLAESTIRERLFFVSLGKYKDASELHLASRKNFLKRWRRTIKAAVPWREQQDVERAASLTEAWDKCKEIATAESILDLMIDTLRKLGVAGESKLAQIVYLCITSRLLDKVLAVAVKGQSSVGK